MTDISDITATVNIEQEWTWPSLGRKMAVVSMDSPLGETQFIVEGDL